MRLSLVFSAASLAILLAAGGMAQADTPKADTTGYFEALSKSNIGAYAQPIDAIHAGDITAYLAFLEGDEDNDISSPTLRALLLSMGAIAADDYDARSQAFT
ncbi:MAG: hypothetical protein AAGK23_10810 [Pseudomonadota bacterium]